MTRVVVLGGSGMLGSMLVDHLSRQEDFEVGATVRTAPLADRVSAAIGNVEWAELDAEGASEGELRGILAGADWVINAIGVIKPYINDADGEQRKRALVVNGLFPYRLVALADEESVRVLQIATDCVFSGARGSYREDDPHDALDVYGKTKSLGEVPSSSVLHLRCSIIGPEPKAGVSLLEWFLGQPPEAGVNGFTNHLWNGITTLQFAKLCAGLMRMDEPPVGVRHVVPGDAVSKADLLSIFARAFDRTDVEIKHIEGPAALDRTLATSDPDAGNRLWAAAGYESPPTIASMVEELAAFEYRLREGF